MQEARQMHLLTGSTSANIKGPISIPLNGCLVMQSNQERLTQWEVISGSPTQYFGFLKGMEPNSKTFGLGSGNGTQCIVHTEDDMR